MAIPEEEREFLEQIKSDLNRMFELSNEFETYEFKDSAISYLKKIISKNKNREIASVLVGLTEMYDIPDNKFTNIIIGDLVELRDGIEKGTIDNPEVLKQFYSELFQKYEKFDFDDYYDKEFGMLMDRIMSNPDLGLDFDFEQFEREATEPILNNMKPQYALPEQFVVDFKERVEGFDYFIGMVNKLEEKLGDDYDHEAELEEIKKLLENALVFYEPKQKLSITKYLEDDDEVRIFDDRMENLQDRLKEVNYEIRGDDFNEMKFISGSSFVVLVDTAEHLAKEHPDDKKLSEFKESLKSLDTKLERLAEMANGREVGISFRK
jgi:hypothetical protein